MGSYRFLGEFILAFIFNMTDLFHYYSGFIPAAVSFLRRVPVLGMILNLPGLSTVDQV